MKLKSINSKYILILIFLFAALLLISSCNSGSSSISETVVVVSTDFEEGQVIYAPLGLSADEIIANFLPEKIEMTMSDGSIETADIYWEAPEDYNSKVKAAYIFSGYYYLPDDSIKEITVEVVLKDDIASVSGQVSFAFDFSYSASVGRASTSSALSSDSLMSSSDEEQYIIAFKSGTKQAERKKIIRDNGAELLKELPSLDAAVIRFLPSAVNAERSLAQNKNVRYIEPNYRVQIFSYQEPNDPLFDQQWNLDMIDLPYAWSYQKGDSNIRIAVIDTGIDLEHEDLAARIDKENAYNFINENSDVSDGHGHGTHVAGIIGAETDNELGIAGVSWQGEILPLKALDDSGGGYVSDVAAAILYAAGLDDHAGDMEPVDIINLSLGTSNGSLTLRDAINEAAAEGILIVAAAGNDGGSIKYPAAYQNAIAVGSANQNGGRAYYSSFGSELDFIAPGGGRNSGILSTYKNNSYTELSGTSMAAPHISGLIALLLSDNNSAYAVKEILEQASIHPGIEEESDEMGYGLINANFAINQIDKIKIIVGEREGDIIEAAAETEISIKGGDYFISDIPVGRYSLFAWIDIKDNSLIEEGDYLLEISELDFTKELNIEEDLTIVLD